MPVMNRSRENGELQDMYRRSLAASAGIQTGELPADKCIEDIFAGGDGWKNKGIQFKIPTPREHLVPGDQHSEEDWEDHVYHQQKNHIRSHSGSSSKSQSTIKGSKQGSDFKHHKSREGLEMRTHTRGKPSTGSIVHGSSSEDSERGRQGYKHAHEVDEFDMREDLVAWELPGRAE
jgi:hypothetical protein